MRGRIALIAMLVATLVLYSARLGYSPIYMHDAEVLFALHARSIAATLRDTNGTFLPLYFHMPSIGANVWFHPLIVYFSALFLRVLPFSEWSARFPTAVVGTIDVCLIYFVSLRLFRSRPYAIVAAALLALTPAHFIHSRLLMDYLYPVPFVLAWLWCLLSFDDTEDMRLIWLAGFVLGAGFYSYIAAVVFMPLYLVFTWLFLLAKFRGLRRAHLFVTIAFCIPLVFFISWRILYPDVFSGTAYRYAITRRGVVFGVLHLLNYNVIGDYVSSYWNFYNPNFLFLVGSPNFQSSTRAAGVFLLPLIIFIAVGLYETAAVENSRVGWLLIAGFLTAPVPAVLVEEPYAIYREMEILPFAILLATFGVRRLLRAKAGYSRALAVVAVLALPVQFGYFLHDYFADYRLNAFGWFGGNTKGAVAQVLEIDSKQPIPAVYVSRRIPYGLERWHFYLDVAGREPMFSRTHWLEPTDAIAMLPQGSVVVVSTADADAADPRFKNEALRKVADVVEPFGSRPKEFEIWLVARSS